MKKNNLFWRAFNYFEDKMYESAERYLEREKVKRDLEREKTLAANIRNRDPRMNQEYQRAGMTQQYQAKCPTCSSPDIERVPSRFSQDPKGEAVRILVFGSRKGEKQFKCKNCGYQW